MEIEVVSKQGIKRGFAHVRMRVSGTRPIVLRRGVKRGFAHVKMRVSQPRPVVSK